MDHQVLLLEQENSRLKALLKEKEDGEGLIASLRQCEHLHESEEKFRKLFEEHSAVMLVIDPDTANIVDANRAAASFYGWSVEELRKMNIQQINLLSPDVLLIEMEKTRLSTQNRYVFCHRRSDGSVRDVEVFSSKVEIAGKEFLDAIVFDITERKLVENALRYSERKFRTITEQIAEIVFVTDSKGLLTYVSQAVEKIFGYKPHEVIGHLFTEYLAEEEIPGALVIFNKTLQDNLSDQVIEFRFRKEDGELFYGEVHVHYYQDQDSSGMMGLIRDVTERKLNEDIRKQYEQELIENGQFLKSIYEELNHSIFVVDVLPDGSYQYKGHNPLNAKLTGISNEVLVGAKPEKVFPPQIAQQFIGNYDACVRRGIPIHFEESMQLMGKEGWWETVLSPVRNDFGRIYRIIGTATNITERKLAEQQLFQLNQTLEERIAERTRELEMMHQQVILNEKLASIGQLAAGIAHELNNPLNFIKINFAAQKENFTDLLLLVNEYREITGKIESMGGCLVTELQQLRRMEGELAIDILLDDITKIFSESYNGFERITTIINSMRTFSTSHAPDERVSFDVNQGIRDTLILARHEYRDIAEIETCLDALLPGLYCNPEQISQLFLNLVVNGAHAIKSQHRSSQGKITIHTWCDSNQVFCSIADDGPGIPEEIRKNIFNPFFSTKEPGKGMGLGLSICYDIVVSKHLGTLSVECPAGGGTVITMGFPSKICPVVGFQPK